MRILHVGDIAYVGNQLCQNLRAQGVEADLIAKKNPLFYTSNPSPWITYVNNLTDEFFLAHKNLRKYDLIHCHYLINLGSLGLRFWNYKTPVILHAHGCDSRPKGFLEHSFQRIVLTQSPWIFYSSPDLRKNLVWTNKELFYIPNPIAIPPSIAPENKFKDKILIYTTLYRLKKTDQIFPIIKDMPFEFHITENGPDIDYYKKIAPKNVKFIPAWPKEKALESISRYPLVIGGSQDGTIRICELEAMSLGIPTLFPFEYNQAYPEPLPMRTITADNVIRSLNDKNLGSLQHDWALRYHGSTRIAEKVKSLYEEFLQKFSRERSLPK